MKTEAAHWPSTPYTTAAPTPSAARKLLLPAALWRTLAASLAGGGVSLLAMWAIETGATSLLGASLWLCGLLLLAVAIDAEPKKHAHWLAASAIAIMLLALAGDQLVPEFSVVGSWLLAGWLAGAIIHGRADRRG